MRSPWSSDSDSEFIIYAILAVILFGGFALFGGIRHSTTKHETQITVEEKWIKSTSGKSQSYMISTETEVFTVRDSLWAWHFRAADVYAKLQPNTTYCVSVSGWRIGFLSMYKNIYRIENQGECA